MAREYDEDTMLQVGLNALEDDSGSALLTQFMADYGIPARVIAGCSGISIPTLYQYLNADGQVRLTRQVEPKVAKLLHRLETLAAEGKLDVSGGLRERDARLIELLTIEDSVQ